MSPWMPASYCEPWSFFYAPGNLEDIFILFLKENHGGTYNGLKFYKQALNTQLFHIYNIHN